MFVWTVRFSGADSHVVAMLPSAGKTVSFLRFCPQWEQIADPGVLTVLHFGQIMAAITSQMAERKIKISLLKSRCLSENSLVSNKKHYVTSVDL